MFKKHLKAIVIIAAVIGVFAAIFGSFLYSMYHNPFGDAQFNRQVWLAAKGNSEQHNPRGPMTEDLRKRYLHKGMSKKDVRVFLGKPDNSEVEEQEGRIDGYHLGSWGFMSIDGDRLIIHYDESGKVVSTEIYCH